MWRRARALARLDRSERRLVAGAALLMWGIRVGLRVSTVGALRRRLARHAHGPTPVTPHAAELVAHAVTRARVVVPGASCLVQAMAVEALLARRGVAARLRIGFGRGGDGSLGGHAWVEAGGTTFGEPISHAVAAGPRVRRA